MWPQYNGIFCYKYELKQLRIKETEFGFSDNSNVASILWHLLS